MTLVKEVRNWYSVLAVYLNIKRSVVARFRNGGFTAISRIEYHKFQEELFMRSYKTMIMYIAQTMEKK